MSTFDFISKSYDNVVSNYSYRYVNDWPLAATPIPTILLTSLYVFFSVYLGPRLMRNRPAYNLKYVLIVYNLVQTVFSMWMMNGFLRNGWLTSYSLTCQPVDYSKNGLAMSTITWWFFISKFTEFLDTIFFVLRKKFNQVSFLHVYHHSVMPFSTWLCVKFLPNGHGTMSSLLNTFVHTVMYFYYFLTALGPQMQPYLWWKKYLTILQMVQFSIIFIHSLISLLSGCQFQTFYAVMLCAKSAFFFKMFFDFYRQSYQRNRKVQVIFFPSYLLLKTSILTETID